MSEPDQGAAAPELRTPARNRPACSSWNAGLPKISEHQLAVLQAALTSAATRFTARGDGVRYLRSIFLAGQERLLSLFTAESIEAVRAVNEAALIPFASIEPGVELQGPDHS